MYGGLKSLLRCVDSAFRTILDVVYPPMCASCHRRLTSSEQGVCVFCASKLVPYRPERWHAEERLWSVPAFRNLYSIYVYSKEQTIQEAIHAYKYHAYTSFARMMARRATLTLPLSGGGYDLIIVVPTTNIFCVMSEQRAKPYLGVGADSRMLWGIFMAILVSM